MKKPVFIEGHIYHVYNRGVDKRNVFLDMRDYFRFVQCLYDFNDSQPVRNVQYYFNRKTGSIDSRKFFGTVSRDPLIELLVFTLMPNHFHLMMRQISDTGIVRFMQKLGTGYTMYFNKKYDRSGSLFQGRFKAEHLSSEEHFIHIPHYIHVNPLKYQGSTSIDELKAYRWSSFRDYIGMKNFPSVTERAFLLDIFGGEEAFLRHTEERLNAMEVQPR